MSRKFCLIGRTLQHSISPEIHMRLFSLLGIAASYTLLELPEVEGAVTHLRQEGFCGCNVTIPYKQDVIAQLDDLSAEAERIGAVNTIAFSPPFPDASCLSSRAVVGYNTDYFGFGRMLEHIDLQGKRAVILGSGGAHKAVAAYLIDRGAQVITVSRRPAEKGQIGYDALTEIDGDILVNATPVGMYPHMDVSPVERSVIARFSILADLIYNPPETRFLAVGRELGKQCIGGLTMLVGQAARAQEIWLGCSIDRALEQQVIQDLAKEGWA